MMMKSAIFVASCLLTIGGTGTLARDVPENIKNFYNLVKPGRCSGSDLLKCGFQDSGSSDPKDWSYCQQSVAGKAIFIKGNNKFANMDIDCDGAPGGGDGRCGSSQDTQGQTSFRDTVKTYGIPNLNANIHPYIVFGNEGSKPGYTTFRPQDHGIKPLSVMAVVCGSKLDKMFYGVWGDTNGDDGPPVVGEASLALGTLCYGTSVNGNSGHDQTDVLYIAFNGTDAVPGKSGANWKASSAAQFESSITALGDKLVARIGSTAGGGSGGGGGGSCSWPGHCTGASCSTGDDCSDDLTCKSGKCG
ncbi:MAG: hypothetical protein M1831_006573 [Alyxoria varia]|nr:MAG: hypothetical protein M1831_006573 [Alyxoria varia]